MRKTKQKKITRKTKQQKKEINIFFEIILIIIMTPLISFFILSLFNTNEQKADFRFITKTSEKNIEIITDKNLYFLGENIKLFIKNNSKKSIYFKPCEYLNQFEKKTSGEWIEVPTYKDMINYDRSAFKRENNITYCEINFPQKGENGIYRAVVQIYYDCKKPGEDACKNSDIFYSNEFEIQNK